MTWLTRLVLAAACCGAHGLAAERPNILYILADDLGYGDVSCYNPKSAWQTPHLDRIAREGLAFTDAHSSSSLCTPSRYSLLTGRYAWRSRLKQGVLQGYGEALIEPGRLTLPGLLRQHGYTTAMFGKWHLGLNWVRTGDQPPDVDFAKPVGGGPTAHGFERFYGISASLDMPPYVWIEDDRVVNQPTDRIEDSPPPRLWRAGAISADFKMAEVEPRLVQKTTEYLRERGRARDGKPFFLYLALAAPHTPLLPTPEFDGKTRTTAYGDFVTQVDADIGRILAALDESGLAANTLVVVTSDNGFAPAAGLPDLAPHHHDPSGGWRGYKSDLFEGGHRVPFLVRWPGRAPAGGRPADLVGQLDLFATCAELLGVRLPDHVAEDSVSMLGVLTGKGSAASGRDSLVHHSAEGRFAIRAGSWKLLLWPGSGGWSSPTPAPSEWLKVPAENLNQLPPFQLYDLSVDPGEKNNLATAQPATTQRLGKLLRSQVENGRSTPGKVQPVDYTAWPQLAWMKQFSP